MEEMATAVFLPENVVVEILLRVSTDDLALATLFHCATTCKRWREIITDRSFVNRIWPPENRCHLSYLAGFFDRQPHGRMDVNGSPYPLFFVPPPAGSPLFGARRRFLASVVPDTPPGFLDCADALAAHGGLLLVRLKRGSFDRTVHMALCDLLTGTWNVLPPLECRVNHVSCAIVTDEDGFPSDHHRPPSSFFKVLAIVLNSYKMDDDQECNLYTFSSAKPHCWSAPTKCFDRMWQMRSPGFVFPTRNNVALCRAVAHWFVPYWEVAAAEQDRYYTYEVSVETGHASLIELSIPADQLDKAFCNSWITLGVTNEGSLSLLCMYKEGGFRKMDMWRREDGSRAWLRTRVVELKPPRPGWDHNYITVWSGKKSGLFLIVDGTGCMHRINVETGAMEEEKSRNGLRRLVPMEIDLPALFTSRLARLS